MAPAHEEFRDDQTPIAVFFTFRTYGTWLHGDSRGSVDRFHNRFGTPRLPPNLQREQYEKRLLKQRPVRLTPRQREAAGDLQKTEMVVMDSQCTTNHVHAVITANSHSKVVRSAIKANATKVMRERGLWRSDLSPWADKGSRVKLWTEQELINAIDYVLYDQGE